MCYESVKYTGKSDTNKQNSLARIRTLSEGIKIPSATVTPRDCGRGKANRTLF